MCYIYILRNILRNILTNYITINYFGYFLHLGPLHRLHLPHPRSIVSAPADFFCTSTLLGHLFQRPLLFHTETIDFAFFADSSFWIFILFLVFLLIFFLKVSAKKTVFNLSFKTLSFFSALSFFFFNFSSSLERFFFLRLLVFFLFYLL